ncbi:MAG: hypothetical protein QOE29_847 [Gaiellaceae bacterium]|nr:hypothetical protein [Gaiellaceae bacterium]
MSDPRERDRGRLRTFLIGGVVGASAAIATARRRRRPRPARQLPGGLSAFEQAPCFEEQMEQRKKR